MIKELVVFKIDKMLRRLIKNIVFKTPFLLAFYKKKLIEKGNIVEYKQHCLDIDDANKVLLESVNIEEGFLVGIVKDDVFFADQNYVSPRSYFPKYERFLNSNNIKYEFFNILTSDWLEVSKKYDLIIWHTASDPNTQKIAKNKIYVLDKILQKKCLPSYDEIWGYEDKINAHYLYQAHGLPEIPTFVSHDRVEIEHFLANTKYPIISKLTTGSASFGVDKLDNKKQAVQLVNKIFGYNGLKTYFPFERQKDYVYFQQFISDATFDLRIITIGNQALGYYRYPNKGDFRASGAGNYEKKEIPNEALDLAFKVKKLYGASCLATDLLYSEKLNKYFIIESSIFIGVDTPNQLEIDGVPGIYNLLADGSYKFEKGKFWIQELTLKAFLEKI
ncbi:ATP-grasp domain-containing protein [Myroides sp. LJL116]